MVLVSAGTALAACAGEAQPKRRLLPSAGKAGNPTCRARSAQSGGEPALPVC